MAGLFKTVTLFQLSEFQIRGSIEDNQRQFSYFRTKIYVVNPHWNGVDEMVVMMDHNISF